MLLGLYGRTSHTAFWEHSERQRLEVRCDHLESQISAILNAFIIESKHPDCVQGRRFRVILPKGDQWRETREEAEAAFREAILEMP